MSANRYVAEILPAEKRKLAPVQIGCSHPFPLNISALAEACSDPPHSLFLCEGCGARWCRR